MVKKGPHPFTGELCAFARLFTASTDKLEQWKSCEDSALKKALLSQLQGTDDHKALEFLEKRCEKFTPTVMLSYQWLRTHRCTLLLAVYKTSLEVSD